MRCATTELKAISPISFSKMIADEKPKEIEYDTWMEQTCYKRLHLNGDGGVVIPAMMLKYCLDEGCRNLSPDEKKFKGNEQWTKYFEFGVYVPEDVPLGVQPEDFAKEWIWASSTGDKGKKAGKRVRRCYPTLSDWTARAKFYVLDDKITERIFALALTSAGMFCGLGRFRPQNQGFYGRFKVESIKWGKI